MIVRLNEDKLLKFLKLCDTLCLKVSPTFVEVIGLKSSNRIISRYTEVGQFDVLEEEEYIISKSSVETLEAFIRSLYSRQSSSTIDFEIDQSMPDIIIKKDSLGNNGANKASISIPIDFEADVWEDLSIDFKLSDKSTVLSRDFIEMMNRANKFVDYRSELKAAQYVSLDINSLGNMTSLGFTGISGYEESMPLQKEMDIMAYTNNQNDIQLLLHSSVLNELYSNRTLLNKNSIVITTNIDETYYCIHDNQYSIYIKKDEVDAIDFNQLFDQDFNLSIKDIPVALLEQALKSIPGSGRADGIVKISIENNFVLFGNDKVKFRICELVDNVGIGNLYFNSRDISNYIKNVKKTSSKTVDMNILSSNKILQMESKSLYSNTRFIVIGLNYENDEDVFI